MGRERGPSSPWGCWAHMEAEPQAGSPSSGRVGGTGAGGLVPSFGAGGLSGSESSVSSSSSLCLPEMPGVECSLAHRGPPECARALQLPCHGPSHRARVSCRLWAERRRGAERDQGLKGEEFLESGKHETGRSA